MSERATPAQPTDSRDAMMYWHERAMQAEIERDEVLKENASLRAHIERRANGSDPLAEQLRAERDEALEALRECYHLLVRYRAGVPLGHQPHMIAHEADEALDRARAILAKAKP